MYHPFLVGEKVYLRGLERADLTTNYFQWLNDKAVTSHMNLGRFPNSIEEMEEFYTRMSKSRNDLALAIMVKKGDKHIGNIAIHGIDWIHRKGEYGIIIGERSAWGKGYGSEATELIIKYVFEQLNLERVWLGVHAGHEAAIRLYEKYGFKKEGRLRKEIFAGGKYHDRLIMGLLKEDFKVSRR